MFPSAPNELDKHIRTAAFSWLRAQTELYGEVLPRALLAEGFDFGGQRVHLISAQGIFKPQILDLPLSITTAPKGPYDDSFGPDHLLRYRYRGTDPSHRDNRGLREVMRHKLPLVYFHGIVPGRYLAVWPVYIVADAPLELTFTVAVDDRLVQTEPATQLMEPAGRRQYATAVVRRRLHQADFREKVLRAYREQCAMCRLKQRPLLDAAHIIGDRETGGEPIVPNGLALCKIHHQAYDSFMLGITPDYEIKVAPRLLEEKDGPMLVHGLQQLEGQKLWVPHARNSKPDPDRLAIRFETYLARSQGI